MDTSRILLDLLIVLVAAKLASEGSERLGIPAVVGEILAGVLIGPSLLGFVGREDEVLRVLGEIGVILLLLEVGMEMDVGELRKVGSSSLLVATIGVVVPMVTGYGMMLAMGESSNTALFVGAALTATSVGITARVFGDLRSLATPEARIVLGAAVADDVMGLVVLTVVVRLVTEGSVSLLSVLGIVAVAIAFLVVSSFAGMRFAPPIFSGISRKARGAGTVVVLAFAFTLLFAELANAAKLAPIVGAFVAGLALGGTRQSERIRTELAPVGHLLIPVFFLMIGIDADINAFFQLAVLRDATILLVVAAIGKVVAAAGAKGAPGDKLLIGLGMLPRGEVGLIFATIGLTNGVLGEDLYASLLLVVLATTLMTPPLLKARSKAVMAKAQAAARAGHTGEVVDPIPVVVDGEVALPGNVADDDGLVLGLRAALLARDVPPSSDLVAWLGGLPEGVATGWSPEERELLLDVIERGTPRSWRFLESTGLLLRALPELDQALQVGREDPLSLDLDAAYRFTTLEQLRRLDAGHPAIQEARRVEHPRQLLFAALLSEVLDRHDDPAADAKAILARIGVPAEEREQIAWLVTDRHLYWAAARRTGALAEDHVRQLAGHFGTPDRARCSYVLAALTESAHERWEVQRLRQLYDLVQDVLGRADEERDLVAARRAEVIGLVGDDDRAVARAVAAAPAYLLAVEPDDVARQLRAVDPVPAKRRFRVTAMDLGEPGVWMLEVLGRDQAGMLAAVAATLAASGFDIRRATFATWSDGAALEVFEVTGGTPPDTEELAGELEQAIVSFVEAGPLTDAVLRFDDRASPWHTVCEFEAPERPGLLAEIAAVFRGAGAAVRSATVTAHDGRVYDTFELTTLSGRKLDPGVQDRIRDLASTGVVVRRRRFGSPEFAAAGPVPQ